MRALEDFGRVRLSDNFFMRDFMYSEISNWHGIPNVPDDPDLAIAAGTALCENLLEPLKDIFGHVTIRSAFRCAAVNDFGNKNGLNCASNDRDLAGHIWDRRDADGHMGATACVVLPWFADLYAGGADWRALAWWIHDNLPYSHLQFFPKLCAFNIQWHERPRRRIDSYIAPRGCLTKPGMPNHEGDHRRWFGDFPSLKSA